MLQSAELQSQIAYWRDRQARNDMTIEDWRQCYTILRQSRAGAQAASSASKAKKAPKGPVDTTALKNSLKALKKL